MANFTAQELEHLNVKEVQSAIDNARAMLNDPTTDWEGMNNAADLMNPATGLHTRIDSKQQYIDTVADLEERLRQREIMMRGGQAQQQPQYQYAPPTQTQTSQQSQGAQVNPTPSFNQSQYNAPGGALSSIRAMAGRYGNNDIHAFYQRVQEIMKNDPTFGNQWFVIPLDKQAPQFISYGLVYSYLLLLFVDQQENGTKVVYSHALAIKSSGDINTHLNVSHGLYKTFSNIIGPYIANVDKYPKRAWRRAVELFMHTAFPDTAPRQGGVPGAVFNHTDAEWQTIEPATSMATSGEGFERLLAQLDIGRQAITARWSAIVHKEASLAEFQYDGFTSAFKLTPFATMNVGGHYERCDFTITFSAEQKNKKNAHMRVNNAGDQSFSSTVVGYVDFRRAVSKNPATQKLTYYEAFLVVTGILHDVPTLSANLLVFGLLSDFCQDYRWLNLIAIPMGRDNHHQYAALAADVSKMNGVLPNGGNLDYTNIDHVRQLLKETCPAMAGIRAHVSVETTTNAALHLMVKAAMKAPVLKDDSQEARKEYEAAVQEAAGASTAVAFAANHLTHNALYTKLGSALNNWSLFSRDNTGYKAAGFFQVGNTIHTTDIWDLVGLLTTIHSTGANSHRAHINDDEGRSTVVLNDIAMRSTIVDHTNTLFGTLKSELNDSLTFTHMNYVLWLDMGGLDALRQALAAAGARNDLIGVANFGSYVSNGVSMLGAYNQQVTFGGNQFGTSFSQTQGFDNLVVPIL